MVPRQEGSVVWATKIVIKRLRVWLQHTLRPPSSLSLLAIIHIFLSLSITHILLVLSIILHLMRHIHLLILWLSLRLKLIVSNSTACPATYTPRNLNHTLCLYLRSRRSLLMETCIIKLSPLMRST